MRPDGRRFSAASASVGRPWRLAAAGALAVAAGATLLPVARDLGPGSASTAVAQAVPLEGHWRSYANGDRPNAALLDGDRLWVGTEGGGLVAWDLASGTYRQYLNPQEPLPANDVNALLQWPDGSLWLATSGGLVRYSPGSDRWQVLTPETSPGMPARYVTALAATGDGRLYVGFSQEWDPDAPHPDPTVKGTGDFRPGGLARYSPGDGLWDDRAVVEIDDVVGQPGSNYKTIPSDNVTTLAIDLAGRLWVGTRPYLVWEPEDCVPGACAGIGEWVPVGGGLAAREGTKWVQWATAEDGATSCFGNHMTDLAVDAAGRTWVATRGKGVLVMLSGLVKVGCANQPRYTRALREGEGLRGNMVWAVDVDEDGGIWMGHGDSPTHGQGIAVLDHGGTFDDWSTPWNTDDTWRFIGFDGVEGKTNALVTVLHAPGSGPAVVGAKDDYDGDGYGMRLLDAGTGRWTAFRTADDGLPSNRISDLAVDAANGRVWFALRSRGVAALDVTTGEWSWWEAYGKAAVGTYTIASADAGARRIQVDLADEPEYEAAFPGNPRYARVGNDPTLYEVTGFSPRRSGAGPWLYLSPVLAHPVRSDTPVYSVARGPASNEARQVAVGADGVAWVGGGLTLWRGGDGSAECDTYPQCYIDGGLGRFDGERWQVFNDANSGLPTNGIGAAEVGAVTVDRAGRVWAATGDRRAAGDGIGVLDPRAMTWEEYTYADGMRGGDGIAGFAVDEQTGDVWTAHHPVLGYITLPNGQQQRYFDGGGASRWNGTAWRSWTKPAATIRAFGDKGITESVLVDRNAGLVWLGGWDGNPVTYHWGLGRDVDAAVNWCPLEACTDGAWSAKVWPDDGTVAALAIDPAGRVWAGTNRAEAGLTPAIAGIKLLVDGTWHTINTSNSGLVSSEISALGAAGGRMWVGTLSRGLSLYLPEPAPTATPEASATPTPSLTPTPSATSETTPTPPYTLTATPSSTASAVTPTATSTARTPCGPSGRCWVLLPYTSRR